MRRLYIVTIALLLAACGPTDQTPVDAPIDEPAVDAGMEEPQEDMSNDDVGADLGMEGDSGGDMEQATVFERGPYNIGHRRFEISYDAVGEPGRTIRLSVWYPTQQEEGDPGEYLINYQRHEVIADAEPSIDGQAPLLVFSHGNSSIAEQSYFMTEFWATHGWVVVAPYHTGNTTFDDLDGISFESASYRPQDITATLDAIYGLEPDDPLASKISEDVVMTGHSFGGFTTLAVAGSDFAVEQVAEECDGSPSEPDACSFIEDDNSLELFAEGFLDDRIDVAIPQAPGGFAVFLDGLSDIEIPTLVLTGALDATLPADEEGDRIWAAMSGDHMRVDLRAGGHFTFSNMCDLIPSVASTDGCGESFIGKDVAYELINAYSLAWARRVLWRDLSNDALLDGTDTRYTEEVQLSWKDGSDLK